jgi:hypothetical protein
VGTRWRERPHGLLTFEMEITAYEPGQRWAERFRSPAANGDVQLRFAEASHGGTQVQLHARMQPPLLLRWSAPWMRRLLRREMQSDLQLAREVLASGQPLT